MLGVYKGDDVAINCTVTAYPRPVVFWQDNSGRMIISGILLTSLKWCGFWEKLDVKEFLKTV